MNDAGILFFPNQHFVRFLFPYNKCNYLLNPLNNFAQRRGWLRTFTVPEILHGLKSLEEGMQSPSSGLSF